MSGERTYRVVQWTTGNVGVRSALAVLANPEYELVGCYAWGPDKVGRDVGELIGADPTGVIATDDVDALLALKPGLRRSTTRCGPTSTSSSASSRAG